ncbi:MAG: alpha/beta hydrolase [Opitutae bacterium]|nr:alpha/beta hydrolase [Opitutae bacterium]
MKFNVMAFIIPFGLSLMAVPSKEIFLWPSGAPGEKKDEFGSETIIAPKSKSDVQRISNVSQPTIKIFPAPESIANGTAVLVCPGGAYNILAIEHEGVDACKWLNSIGVTAVLLKYRVPRRKDRLKHVAPLQDAQRAMGIIRRESRKWNIDPDKIGILGFSAGGNLAVMACTTFDSRSYAKVDSSDDFSCRPDFAILIYPAYLVGRIERDFLFPEINVTADCPPCFFAHAGDDHVPAEGSILLYLALRKAGVVGNELHVYPDGGHGYGMRESSNQVSSWPTRAKDWMNAMRWL